MKKNTFLIFTLSVLVGFFSANTAAQEKIKIARASDLPRRTVELKGKALEILDDKAQLDRLAEQLLKNIKADLEKYEIEDKATLAGLYALVSNLHIYRGEFDEALKYTPLIRELETKPAVKAMIGVFWDSYAKALRDAPDRESAAFKTAFEKHYAAALSKIQYDLIAESVEAQKAQLTLQNKEVILGGLQSGLQPVLDKNNNVVPEGVVASFVGLRNALDLQFPLTEQRLRVLNALYAANHKNVKKGNIWAEREVNFAASDKLTPVVVGIWDSGTDVANLPAENRWTNPKETFNGKDDDGNGFVDDVHGIGYDLANYRKSAGTLNDPTGKIKSDPKKLLRLAKGSIDLQSSIQSEEAREFQQTYAALKREQAKEFSEELGFFTHYSHGTHVAGIAAAGNPAAKILAARMSWSHQSPPPVPTLERARFTAQMYRDIVDYFKRNNVRVVNMSWRYNSASIEGALTANGIGKTADERKRLAQELFGIEKQALYEAIKNAPEILFVAGSGNENNDANFSEYIPATFDLPNLVTVGAVDSEGRKTAFTTEGKSVRLYANGYEVESFVPGGDRLKMSGTSMASPQVANLAAKLLAVNPKLKPSELIKLINDGAEASAEDPKIRLINQKKTLALVKK
jgi:subtilisin family serine protease